MPPRYVCTAKAVKEKNKKKGLLPSVNVTSDIRWQQINVEESKPSEFQDTDAIIYMCQCFGAICSIREAEGLSDQSMPLAPASYMRWEVRHELHPVRESFYYHANVIHPMNSSAEHQSIRSAGKVCPSVCALKVVYTQY